MSSIVVSSLQTAYLCITSTYCMNAFICLICNFVCTRAMVNTYIKCSAWPSSHKLHECLHAHTYAAIFIWCHMYNIIWPKAIWPQNHTQKPLHGTMSPHIQMYTNASYVSHNRELTFQAICMDLNWDVHVTQGQYQNRMFRLHVSSSAETESHIVISFSWWRPTYTWLKLVFIADNNTLSRTQLVVIHPLQDILTQRSLSTAYRIRSEVRDGYF